MHTKCFVRTCLIMLRVCTLFLVLFCLSCCSCIIRFGDPWNNHILFLFAVLAATCTWTQALFRSGKEGLDSRLAIVIHVCTHIHVNHGNTCTCSCSLIFSWLYFPPLSVCSAGYYVKVMKKIQDKGDEYVKNENERLGRILGESMKHKITSVFWVYTVEPLIKDSLSLY